jgi:hypothetical protein
MSPQFSGNNDHLLDLWEKWDYDQIVIMPNWFCRERKVPEELLEIFRHATRIPSSRYKRATTLVKHATRLSATTGVKHASMTVMPKYTNANNREAKITALTSILIAFLSAQGATFS